MLKLEINCFATFRNRLMYDVGELNVHLTHVGPIHVRAFDTA